MSMKLSPGMVRTAEGTVRQVDLLNREIQVQVDDALRSFDVPPGCEISLAGERVKLRLLQPFDRVRVGYTQRGESSVAVSITASWFLSTTPPCS